MIMAIKVLSSPIRGAGEVRIQKGPSVITPLQRRSTHTIATADHKVQRMDTTASPAAEMDVTTDTSTPDSGFTVTINCSTGNEYDGRLGLRVSAVFVILVGSLLGTILPIVLARSTRLQVPKLVFFILKYFGSGVIIATAFIHLLAPAVEALGSPCINPDSPITQYPWPEGICLMTVFAMFFVELLASHYDILGTGGIGIQGAKAHDPALDLIRASGKGQDEEIGNGMKYVP